MVKTGIGNGSGNFDLLKILLGGSEVWNHWRKQNSEVEVNLSNVNLSGTDLSGTDLRNIDS